VEVLCFGNIVVDLRRPSEEVDEGREPLRIVDRPIELRVGGVAILAVALRRIGLSVGLMGAVGRDLAGYGLREYLRTEVGIDVRGVRALSVPTSASFIRLSGGQRYVEHSLGASGELSPEDGDLAIVEKCAPRLVATGYAGLLPRLDAGHGEGMARWIEGVQAKGALAALDTHTVPPYQMLERPMQVVDVFICNREEGPGITGRPGAPPEEVVATLWARFLQKDPGKPRLLGMTTADGVQLAYGRGDQVATAWVGNPGFGTLSPEDLTGAGDCFRAGVYAYLVQHVGEWRSGELDLRALGRWGHAVATECLSRKAIQPPSLSALEAG